MTANERQVPQANWVRELNTAGRYLGPEKVVPMNVAQLLEDAKAQTGLSDFGSDSFREGLEVLIDALNREAQLSLIGRLVAGEEIRRVLQSRLRVIAFEKRHPEVQSEKIAAPVFIIGMGRTGSTILHEYLSKDPAHRAPLLWEMRLPCPIDSRLSPEEDVAARIAWSEAETRIQYEIDESLVSKHEQRWDLPEECSQLMAYEFRSGHFFSRNNVPSYAQWNARADVRPALEMHKRILKILQFQSGKQRRWVLKYGGHMPHIPALLEVYPDARIIHTHRDPAAVVQSFVSLMASTRLMRSDLFDAAQASEMLNAGMSRIVNKVIAERESGVIPAAQIADIHFKPLMADALGEIRRAYEQLGLPFTEQGSAEIERYVKERPRTKHGKHEYAYADVVDLERERQRYADYVRHYGIEEER
ncbi:MAG: sulfotransferase [Nevskia sp.]|nr:sulfotransferase [Nevskia sp.]